ncbi:hypothetical protein NE237_027411 [Protea cynaroides]|uniref:Uncharacterized protein n=1 Tax=Protea cynaroides TaxID=273540 RepID=A0A9Q0GNH5_9MAGN|nr:hypothetical protein NE237_027411 [Protea cynaroides]
MIYAFFLSISALLIFDDFLCLIILCLFLKNPIKGQQLLLTIDLQINLQKQAASSDLLHFWQILPPGSHRVMLEADLCVHWYKRFEREIQIHSWISIVFSFSPVAPVIP